MTPPARGDIWLADLNPTRGHEQAGRRPVLIVSEDLFNHGPADLVIVCPLTSTQRRIPAHVPITPPEGFEAMYINAKDTLSDIPTPRLVERYYPKLMDHVQGVEEFECLISTDRANSLIGFEPRFSWRR